MDNCRETFEKIPEIRDSLSENIVFVEKKYTTANDGFYDLVNWLNGAWFMHKEQQKRIDELQARLNAVKGLAQALWEKSNDKHKQGKVWESKTLGECADEILDVLEQALKGGEK